MDNPIFKKGDIVYFNGNKNSLGVVLEVNYKKNKEHLIIDRGFRISKSFVISNNHKQMIFKSDKTDFTKDDLIKYRKNYLQKRKIERQEKRLEQDHLLKTAEYRPLYKKSFRNFCYKKAFIKGL